MNAQEARTQVNNNLEAQVSKHTQFMHTLIKSASERCENTAACQIKSEEIKVLVSIVFQELGFSILPSKEDVLKIAW